MTLPRSFYARPAVDVARDLLGRILVVRHDSGLRRGRIVETEAYAGPHDLACHTSRGRTPRTEVMFGPPGFAYVYLIYGMYDCFNVVTDSEGVGAAVLVRALEPLEGLSVELRTDGPGRLTRALGITRAHNRADLTGRAVYVEQGASVPVAEITTGPRVGVAYAKEWAQAPYRFWVAGSRHVSRPKP